MLKIYSIFSLSLLLLFTRDAQARSSGAPLGVCSNGLIPDPTAHSGAVQASDLPGGFYIFSELLDEEIDGEYMANTTYDVTLASLGGEFLGFVVQAREQGTTTVIGSFTILDSGNSQRLACDSAEGTVTHTNSRAKNRVSFTWTSPASSNGTVEFRYTVVVGRFLNYYANLDAAVYRPPCPFLPTEYGAHSLQFGLPNDCSGTDCDYYVGINQNEDDPAYLDVYLNGEASGWIALGFSLNQQMDSDDVLGCRVSGSDVVAVDTWNPSPRGTSNELDATQTDVCQHFGSFDNGRITCSFSRLIEATDMGQDYNLNNTFFPLFGRRLTAQSISSLDSHLVDRINPIANPISFNPVLDNNQDPVPVVNLTCPPAPASDAVFSFQFNNPGDEYYLATRVNPTNPAFLDITLEADVEGWVAIGFSANQQMESDDVLGCIRDANDNNRVTVLDTWNPSNRRQANVPDPTLEGVCPHSSDFDDGRISCTFSRLMAPIDDNDVNLNQSWFLLFGTSDDPQGGLSFRQHTATPMISESRTNVVLEASSATSDFPRAQLLKVHGILMIVTWPLLVVTAIFFAAWMRPALPNGEWFQVHRVFMVVALFVGALGFIFAFVANADRSPPGLINFACYNTGHFVIGIIVFALQIINPIIAIFRCNPTEKNRWIFNLTHGTLIGFIAELLALVNVGMGIALLEANGCNVLSISEYTALPVYIAFVCFLLVLQVVLFVIFTVSAFITEPEKRAGIAPTMLKYFLSTPKKSEKPVEMTDPKAAAKPSNDPPPRKPPSKDAPFRWIGLAVFLPVTLILMLTIIILIIVN